MTLATFAGGGVLVCEIGETTLRAAAGAMEFELPIERHPDGTLTGACRESMLRRLEQCARELGWHPRRRAYCAIGARGVSLRRIELPSAENLESLLRFQIEKDLPLPPDELAWGWTRMPSEAPGTGAGVRTLVVAVKKETVNEYAVLFRAAGFEPFFTLATWAARALCPLQPSRCAILNIGRRTTEWFTFSNDLPEAIRVLPWGGESITAAIANEAGLTMDQAEMVKRVSGADGGRPGEAMRRVIGELAMALRPHWNGEKIYVAGETARQPFFRVCLEELMENGATVEALEAAQSGSSAAVAGLTKRLREEPSRLALELRSVPSAGQVRPSRVPWRWAPAVAGLCLLLFLGRYAEPVLKRAGLERRMTQVRAESVALPEIDQEIAFLEHLQQTQPRYLDALALLAEAAPRGVRIESLNISRRGDLTFRATMQNPQQATELRAKLTDSGWFPSVVVEEQAPSPDRQKVAVRVNARWLNPKNGRANAKTL